MEDFLKSLNNLNECFGKEDLSALKGSDANVLKTLCLNERIKVIELVTGDSLKTKNLVHERLAILKDRNADNKIDRINFLDRVMGK